MQMNRMQNAECKMEGPEIGGTGGSPIPLFEGLNEE
jgi:hypothetical protein